MAPRSRRSAAAAAEAAEDEHQAQHAQDGTPQLRFKAALVGRPGKQIGVSDLLTRLKALLDELRTLDQDDAPREALMPIAQELAHQSLLQHKEAGVRAWAVCCIVDMLKLFAPDAPYPASKLKEIFSVIILKLLPLLADPANPYNSQHMYVLRSLAEWKSILLINEIPGSEQLTSALFTICFDVLSAPSKSNSAEELSRNVEHNMTEVLSTIIDEAPAIAHDVVDVVVAQFLWADPITLGSTAKSKKSAPVDAKQSTLRRKEAPPAYNMARNVCNAHPEKMARLIGNYFSAVIVDFTNTGPSFKSHSRNQAADEEIEDEVPKGPSEEDIAEAQKAHRLLRELWKCCPGVLQDIIPHLQDELATENVQLRQMATETFGDMISGIGAAGPPLAPELDPVAYPSQSLSHSEQTQTFDFLTTPASINSFPTQYPVAYHAFLQRKNDKSSVIRASWTTAVGRILMTGAGGIGLDPEEEQKMLKSFADCFIDSDEKVRLAAVKAIEQFNFDLIVRKLGSNGGMAQSGSILSNFADRVKDKKSVIHSESIRILAKLWGVAAGAISNGDETIRTLLGPIPSRILETCYVNDTEINMHVDKALYESLLPLLYPPIKAKAVATTTSQIVKDSQTGSERAFMEADIDKIRAERQLVLVSGLEEKAKKVFFAKQANQVSNATYMEHFLKLCEAYNGGMGDKSVKDTKQKLDGLISYYAKTLSDASRVADDLWKFAKNHDRRAYTLIRFCMDPASDYRRVVKSIKELRKRIEDSSSPALLETLNALLYRVSLLCYNKSHVPAIIEFTRADDSSLASIAHEVLKEISTKHPKVFSTHVKDLCKTLENEAPSSSSPNPSGAVDDLKACAAFAKKFPSDIPVNSKDSRKLLQSFLNFALYGTPPQAAKHAITIIMNSDNKKELHAREILTKTIKSFKIGNDHWLTKLAALSQLVLLAQSECEDEMDSILEIVIKKVLRQPHVRSAEADADWMEVPDDDIQGRTWAIKVLVNRLRSLSSETNLGAVVEDTYALLNRLVKHSGGESDSDDAPSAHRTRQRLLAANSLLKLSCAKRMDYFLTPSGFIQLALVTHDPCVQVRKGFAEKLMKYLGQGRLPSRFYTTLFFLAHDPDRNLKTSIMTWVRSRRSAFAARKETVLESVFARLLSLLAHHPDFDRDNDVLKLMSEYILFYLKCVATEENISLIFHVAQRVKGVADGIEPSRQADENLYILSDLAQALIRSWEEQSGWTIQSWPGKLKLPAGIFRPLESHDRAQEIATKSWIDEDLIVDLDLLVRRAIRNKKRKAADDHDKPHKKVRGNKVPKEKKMKVDRPLKTPRKKRRADDDGSDLDGPVAPSSGPTRKSGRQSTLHKSYVEVSSDEEGAEAGVDEDEASSEAEDLSSPAPADDVEMGESDDEQTRDNSEPVDQEPSPEPPSRKTRTNGMAKAAANGNKSTPRAQKRKVADAAEQTTPVKTTKSAAKAKAKVSTKAANSSPISPVVKENGAVRRSARTRS